MPDTADTLGTVRFMQSWRTAGAATGAVAVNDPRELRAVRKALQADAPVDLSGWSLVEI